MERWVMKSARADFNIVDEVEVLSFLSNQSKEVFEFVNSMSYRKSREMPPPYCDAYTFKHRSKEGYLSFYYSYDSDRWVIKSFHISVQPEEDRWEIAKTKGNLKRIFIGGSR